MKIRIIETPSGEAPENIREQWVGLVLPVDTFVDLRIGVQESMLGGPPEPENIDGFPVKIEDAVNALKEAGRLKAALWFENNFFGRDATHLIFGKSFCELSPLILSF